MRRGFSAILAATLLLTFLVIPIPAANAAETCTVRVDLESIGTPASISVQVNGSYMIENRPDLVMQSGGDYFITNSGGSLSISGSGISGTQNVGTSFKILEYQSASSTRNYVYVRDVMRSYLGSMAFSASGGGVKLINHVFIEDYVMGVIRWEMNDSFPIEALKAQAVAARTYVYRSMNGQSSKDIGDTDKDQVYRGYKSSEANVARAVEETKGLILYSGGTLHYTYYGASNGGQIETIANRLPTMPRAPYAIMKDDPYDLRNPESPVDSLVLSKSGGISNYALEQVLRSRMGNSYGQIVGIQSISLSNPRTTDPNEGSRYYRTMTFNLLVGEGGSSGYDYSTSGGTGATTGQGALGAGSGSLGGGGGSSGVTAGGSSAYSGSTTVVQVNVDTQSDLINIISPTYRCSLFTVVEDGSTFTIQARRFGHGIGMSQRGAQQMGKEGFPYTDILAFYYTNSTLTQKDFVRAALPGGGSDVTDPGTGTGGIWDSGSGAATGAIGTGIVKASSLNVRASASSSAAKIGTLTNNASVIILAQSGDFYAIQYGNVTGYVAKAYITANITGSGGTGSDAGTSAGTASRTGTITLQTASSNLNLRSGPSTSSSIVTTVKHGAKVTVTGTSGDWSSVQVTNGPSGYVMTKYIALDPDTGTGSAGGGIIGTETPPPVVVTPSPTPVAGGYYGALGAGLGTVVTPTPTPSAGSGSIWDAGGTAATATPAPAATQAPTGTIYGTIKSSSGNVMLRSEGSTTAPAIAQMNSGIQVVVHGFSGDWFKITAGSSYTGWVHKDYITVNGTVPNLGAATGGTATPTQATVVLASAGSSLNIRSGPGTENPSVGFLSHGAAITVGAESGDWVAIVFNGISGYIKKQYVSTYAGTGSSDSGTPAKTMATVKLSSASSTLNVRSGAGTTFSAIASVKNGETVTLLGTSGEWSQIQTSANATGYVMSKYLSAGSSGAGTSAGGTASSSATTTGNVHLREKADKASTSLGVVPGGTKLTVTSKGAEFSKVTYNNKTGYVSNQYLKF